MKFFSAISVLALANVANADLATVEVSVDFDSSSNFPHSWKESFGSGHALLATRADWREHLELAIKDIGIKRLRFHGIFDDDMSVTR